MNQSAKEMFEELGYKEILKHSPDIICYVKDYQFVHFNIDKKSYYTIKDEPEGAIGLFFVDMNLHNAINKQLEELGWYPYNAVESKQVSNSSEQQKVPTMQEVFDPSKYTF